MDNEKEIKSLLAETIAVQTVLVHVLRRLAKSDTNLWKAIAAGFDDAVSEAQFASDPYILQQRRRLLGQGLSIVLTMACHAVASRPLGAMRRTSSKTE